MTKEIIINGVNVAGCEFFNDCECKLYKQEYWELTDTTFDFCKEHPLCEYKATAILERLEQENKNLKDINNYLQVIIDDGRAENKRFREENKELKELNKKICEDWEKEIKVYWNALEEIREILIVCQTFRTCERCKFYKECDKDLEGYIKDKINEVLNEKEL